VARWSRAIAATVANPESREKRYDPLRKPNGP
jgi:hypothetical protein